MLLHAAMQCRLVPQRPQIEKACQAGPTKSKQRQLLEQHYNPRADRGGAYAADQGARAQQQHVRDPFGFNR